MEGKGIELNTNVVKALRNALTSATYINTAQQVKVNMPRGAAQ